MHSTKEAILANEHDPDLKSFIFYIDLRAVGKGFQEYVHRAEADYNVTFIRSKVGGLMEDPVTNNPILWYEDIRDGEVKSLDADLVVLAHTLVPSRSVHTLSEILGFEIDEYGFVISPENADSPIDTTVPGIYACGYVRAPQDIPESVAQASGAAARAAEILSYSGGGD